MNEYPAPMMIGDRLRKLRREYGLTQDDLVLKSGVSLATIQRVERGAAVSANTIASLAAAFGVEASQLTSPTNSGEPYLALEPLNSGRPLLTLLRASERLDFDFAELQDFRQAELVEELQNWCLAQLGRHDLEAAVERVTLELEATDLLKRLTETHLTASGNTYKINCYEVDDEFDSMPMLLAQWDQNCAVIRVGCKNSWVDRAYVIQRLGKWETPATDELIHPNIEEVD